MANLKPILFGVVVGIILTVMDLGILVHPFKFFIILGLIVAWGIVGE